MSSAFPTRLTANLREADNVVLWHDTQAITWAKWFADVAALTARLEQEPDGDWPVFFTDGYAASVAVFALWASNKRPLMLPDTATQTLQGLTIEVSGCLADTTLSIANQIDVWQPSLETAQMPGALELCCDTALMTSGSTGKPTISTKKAQQLLAEVELYAQMWPQELADATLVATVSHQHIYGLLFKVLLAFITARPFVAQMYSNPRTLLNTSKKFGTCAWVASPAQLKRLNAEIIADLSTAHIGLIFSSGGLLDIEAAATVNHLFAAPAFEIYGSTETGGIAWRQQHAADGTDMWQLMNGVTGALTDEGLLQVTSAFTDHQPITTGDRVELRNQGFHLLGRADKIVKLEEKRISLTAVEQACTDLDTIAEARCVVLPGKREQLACVAILTDIGVEVFTKAGRNAFSQQLRQVLKTTLPTHAVPRRFRFVGQFPLTSQGKIRAQDLIAEFEDGQRAVLPLVHAVQESQPSEVASSVTLDLAIPADLDFFADHFASFPVVPGVVQLNWVRHYARLHLGFSGAVCKMSQVKFKAMIRPGQMLKLTLDYHLKSGRLKYRLYAANDFSSGIMWDNEAQKEASASRLEADS